MTFEKSISFHLVAGSGRGRGGLSCFCGGRFYRRFSQTFGKTAEKRKGGGYNYGPLPLGGAIRSSFSCLLH